MNKEWKSDALMLAPICSVAVGLRMFFANYKHYISDEIFQVFIVSRSTLASAWVNMINSSPQAHPVDYFIDLVYVRLFGDIDSLIYLKMFWGILSIILLFYIGKTFWNKQLGFVAAFQMTFSYFHIEYSLKVRQYSLILFLTLLSSFLFMLAWQNRRWIWAYVVSMIFYQLATPYALCFGVVQMGAILMAKKSRVFLIGPVASFVIGLIWFLLIGNQVLQSNVYSYGVFHSIGWVRITEVMFAFGHGERLSILMIASFIIGAIIGLRSKEHQNSMKMALSFFIVTTLAVIFSLWKSSYVLRPHHLIAAFPVFLLINSLSIIALGEYSKNKFRKPTRTYWLAYYSLVSLLFLPTSANSIEKLIFRNIPARNILKVEAQFLKDNLTSLDAVIFCNPTFAATLLHFMDKQEFLDMKAMHMKDGFAVMEMKGSSKLNIGETTVPIYSLCRIAPHLATIDRHTFGKLKVDVMERGGRIYFINTVINYIHEKSLWETELGIDINKMKEEIPTIYSWN